MFGDFVALAGGVNRAAHIRQPTPLDAQTVIRMNRDTLYSFAVVDISEGATIVLPESGDRYLSAMIVNRDHHINRIFHEAGEHELTVDEFDTPFVCVVMRTLVDPSDPADVAAVAAIQDQFEVRANAATPWEVPDWDVASLDATRNGLLELARGVDGFEGAFGSAEETDPILHLLGAAGGWGGLPDSEARYLNVDPGLPPGRYRISVRDVPVDGFWSISLYDAAGYFPNTGEQVSVNSVTGVADDDGTITVHFGDWGDDVPNRLPTMEGWNYLVRLYRPRPEVHDGSWTFPAIEEV
jgi:hypothetical protein